AQALIKPLAEGQICWIARIGERSALRNRSGVHVAYEEVALKRVARLHVLPSQCKDRWQVCDRGGVLGIVSHCTPKARDRIIIPMQHEIAGPRELVQDCEIGVKWTQPHCLFGVVDRLLRAPEIEACCGQVAVCWSEARIQLEAALRCRNCFCGPP